MTTRRLLRDLRHIKCCGWKKGTEIFGKICHDELTPYLHQNYEVPNEWPHKIFKVSNNNHAVVVNYNENWERHCYCGFFCNYALLKVTSVVQLLVQSDGQLFLLNLHITEVFSYDYRNEK